MTTTHKLLIAATLLAGTFSTYAALPAGAPTSNTAAAQKGSVMVAAADMADGEIRKVDIENKKLTIKHGEIKNLDMPGMTMVFQVKDAAVLTKLKAGDKVKFSAEKSGSAIVVTDIQLAK